MKNIEKISSIRASIKSLSNDSVVYMWWFKKDCVDSLLKPLSVSIATLNLEHKVIYGVDYYCLYVGIGQSCKERFNWHINQEHSESTINSGVLSTLRNTLSALLGLDCSKSMNAVNDFIDTNCNLEWDLYPSKSKKELEEIESKLINGDFQRPLNIQGNENMPKESLSKLTELRKLHKK